ncbi:glycosyltransferase family 2 protein [Nitrosophilus alvini]|uniref:glycosyltransferase family 2 protein n=1 Tax=Nitrosophilus alvini TaxID=2714855 RepID=UPI00190AA1E6|nr:glycosyltransferase family 2 protein [Nitrosophilus alvini]
MEKLSVVIITFNSEKYIKEAVESASFADEVLVLDSGSSDNTAKIAKELGARVEYQKWLGFGKQKQKAVDLAKNRWVFVLDSDERITENLQKEIKEILKNPKFEAYEVPRLNYFFGKPIKHCGLYPDKTIRLFDKEKARFTSDEVHEKVVTESKTGSLKNHMLHLAYDSVEEFIDKQNRYSSLGAKPNRIKAVINPPWTFFKIFFLKLGFLDGWHGYLIAKLYSQYTFWKYIKKGGA